MSEYIPKEITVVEGESRRVFKSFMREGKEYYHGPNGQEYVMLTNKHGCAYFRNIGRQTISPNRIQPLTPKQIEEVAKIHKDGFSDWLGDKNPDGFVEALLDGKVKEVSPLPSQRKTFMQIDTGTWTEFDNYAGSGKNMFELPEVKSCLGHYDISSVSLNGERVGDPVRHVFPAIHLSAKCITSEEAIRVLREDLKLFIAPTLARFGGWTASARVMSFLIKPSISNVGDNFYAYCSAHVWFSYCPQDTIGTCKDFGFKTIAQEGSIGYFSPSILEADNLLWRIGQQELIDRLAPIEKERASSQTIGAPWSSSKTVSIP